LGWEAAADLAFVLTTYFFFGVNLCFSIFCGSMSTFPMLSHPNTPIPQYPQITDLYPRKTNHPEA
jgi:hypothetical protein